MRHIPEHILQQVHVLASDGEPVEQIAFLLRMSREAVEEELKHPTVTAPSVNTTKSKKSE